MLFVLMNELLFRHSYDPISKILPIHLLPHDKLIIRIVNLDLSYITIEHCRRKLSSMIDARVHSYTCTRTLGKQNDRLPDDSFCREEGARPSLLLNPYAVLSHMVERCSLLSSLGRC